MQLKDAIKLVAMATAEERAKATLELLDEEGSSELLGPLQLVNIHNKISMLKNIDPREITMQNLLRLDVKNYDLVHISGSIPKISDMLLDLTQSPEIKQAILKNKISAS